MSPSIEAQNWFFDTLKKRVPHGTNYINVVGELLTLKKSAVYKRVKGETLLDLNELLVLSRHFHIPLDQLPGTSESTVSFQLGAVEKEIRSFDDFLNPIFLDVQKFAQIPECSIRYASNDIPFFYYTLFESIFAFKLFAWGRIAWRMPELLNAPFSLSMVEGHRPSFEKAKSIGLSYLNLPSIEFWTTEIIDNTINQIVYYLMSGAFKQPEDALVLIEDLKKMVDHFHKMAKAGKKFDYGQNPEEAKAALQLYHNEITLTNNTILIESHLGGAVFFNYDNANVMRSEDDKIRAYTSSYLDRLSKHSHLISTEGEKNRQQFFTQIERKFRRAEKQLKVILEF